MKRRGAAPRRRRLLAPGLNLTPLLDAILNLVFFFLLATQLRTNDAALKVNLPAAETASETTSSDETPTVTVDSEGKIHYKGGELGEEELELRVIQLVKEGRTEMNIRGDESANFGRIIRVMDICKRAGLREVLINAEKKREAD